MVMVLGVGAKVELVIYKIILKTKTTLGAVLLHHIFYVYDINLILN